MKQADLGLNLTTKRTRKREFLDEMNRVVPWSALVEPVAARCMRRSRMVAAMVASPRYLPQSCTTRLEVTMRLRRCL